METALSMSNSLLYSKNSTNHTNPPKAMLIVDFQGERMAMVVLLSLNLQILQHGILYTRKVMIFMSIVSK